MEQDIPMTPDIPPRFVEDHIVRARQRDASSRKKAMTRQALHTYEQHNDLGIYRPEEAPS